MTPKRGFFKQVSQSDPATIRKRYLELIREYPPERFPEEFQTVQLEYEKLTNVRDRLNRLIVYTLPDEDSWEDMWSEINEENETVRFPLEVILGLGRKL